MTIEVDHVYKSYDGKPVLTDFSLDIETKQHCSALS